MPALAAAGYRVVAPFLRGYHPTAIPTNGYYDKATLVTYVAALIRALSGGEPVHLVGKDWGAIVSYDNVAAFIDYLWTYWTSPGHEDAAHIASVKAMLAQPGVLTAPPSATTAPCWTPPRATRPWQNCAR